MEKVARLHGSRVSFEIKIDESNEIYCDYCKMKVHGLVVEMDNGSQLKWLSCGCVYTWDKGSQSQSIRLGGFNC